MGNKKNQKRRKDNNGNGELINASPRIDRLRKWFFSYRRSLCIERARIVYDYYKDSKNKSLPLILQRAGAFRSVLNRIPITIYKDELLVGSLASRPRAYPMFPEIWGDIYSSELESVSIRETDPFEISEADKKELQEKIFPLWKGQSLMERLKAIINPTESQFLFKKREEFDEGTGIMSVEEALHCGTGYATLDYPKLLEKGFHGIKEEAVAYLEKLDPLSGKDVEKANFYRAVIECCEGMIEFGLRFSQLAANKAASESNLIRRKELETISRICSRVPGYPATNFYEALQSIWFTYVSILQEGYERCMPLGRMDIYLFPFYKRDLDEGRLTVEEAQELLDCLWLKLAETNTIHWGSSGKLIAGFPSQQHIPVGGQTREGKDAVTPLTYQCIQATMNTRLFQPSISIRLHKHSPMELYHKACQLARMGTGHPSFFNDEVVVPALVNNGVSIEDARDYSPVGCVGVQVSGCGKGSHIGGYLNVPAALELVLTNGKWYGGEKQISIHTGDPSKFTTIDQLWDAFEKHLRHLIRVLLGLSLKIEHIHEQYLPTPYLSSLIKGCLEKGYDKSREGAIYNLGMSFRSVGLGSVADALASVKKMVFEEQMVSMSELMQALKSGFEGNEILRQRLVTRTPHYGNDDNYVDEVARKVVWVLTDECKKHKSYFGGDFQPGFGSVSSHVPYGKILMAFPDGRKRGDILSDGIGPVPTRDQNGPTALLKSVGKMDHIGLSGVIS